jgi:DNA mismatch repair protein MSH2
LDQLKGTLEDFSKLREMLEQCIDIGKAKQNDYIINPRFSPELSQIDTEITKVKRKIEDLRRKVEDDLECNKAVNLVESQMHTFVFECDKKEGDAGMRKQKKKYNYKIISIKNKIMSFSVQELKDLVREYNELEDQYRALQNELVLKVLEIASTYYPLLETVSSIISQLDVLCAFAMVSSTHQYVKPLICPEEKEQVYLIESKHPLIHIQDPATCINNDCRMVRNKTNLQIITGPNMGGKSTYIRQVAICVLLAHIGMS